MTGPAKNTGNADAAFVEGTFLGSQRAGVSIGVSAGNGGAVVGGEHNEGVFAEAEFVKGGEDASYGMVELSDVPVVSAFGGIGEIFVGCLMSGIGSDGFVRFVEAHICEERRGLLAGRS